MPHSKILIAIIAVTVVILLLIVGIVMVILVARRQNLAQQLKDSVYKNKLNDVSLAALRAQMNPHFIFNCLNSIKLYTEQNNSVAASEYLSKFARLIRNILDNSKEERTSLAAEIDTLRLYLDMEVMRFKDRMSYEIVVGQNVDTEFIDIPPLLIQPYVENAIWHGIMHKEGAGKVVIRIEHSASANEIAITVEDNGVGRLTASAFRAGGEETHKSYGTQLANDRIALFNEKMRSSASVTIEDLYDESDTPRGTLITLKLVLL